MQESKARNRSLIFADYQADPLLRTLTRGGVPLRLQQKPLSVLFYLVNHAGRLVTRTELHRELWPSGTHVDFDRGLSVAIHKLRVGLNDSRSPSRIIETIPGRGYRFIAPVTHLSESPHEAYEVMLVVLPFLSLSPTPEACIADGFTEELTAQLSRAVPGRLGVIGRTTAMSYRGSKESIATIGSDLRVDYVVEGSIRDGDGVFRLVAQLIRVSDQSHVWTESVEHDSRNIFRAQIELSAQIARAIAAHLFPGKQQVLKTRPRHRPKQEAYRVFMEGYTYYFPGPDARSGVMGLRCFHEAISLDPDFAEAHALLSILYTGAAMFDSGIVIDASLPTLALQGKQFAWRALELDPESGEANAAMAWQEFQFGWNWPSAENHFKRALDLNPNFAMAHMIYAWVLLQMGQQDESRRQILIARALDPGSIFFGQWEGILLYYSRDFSGSARVLEQVLAQNSHHGWTRLFLARSYIRSSRNDEAVELLDHYLRFSEGHAFGQIALVRAHASAGRYVRARRSLSDLYDSAVSQAVDPYQLATALTSIGDFDRAFDSLDRALKQRSGWIPHLSIDPDLDPLRSDARWNHLCERIKSMKAAGIWSLG
jgi:TolB-like protein/tetratricopeptide (TPR) repeat protein